VYLLTYLLTYLKLVSSSLSTDRPLLAGKMFARTDQ